MKRVFICILVLCVFDSISFGDTIYKWVDKEGVAHFTDDYDKIPREYRNQVRTENTGAPQNIGASTPSPPVASERQDEGKERDKYGLGEDYWRSRALPWKNQLREATKNYENVQRRISDNMDERSGRFLSRTQWNMARAESRQLLEERSKYEEQIKEAKEMLQKIAGEAEEAKANPDWIK